MITIGAYYREVHLAYEPTGLYIIDDTSTMGRLIKRMLEKGHFGQPSYGHEYHRDVSYIRSIEVDNPKIDQGVIRQIQDLHRQGRSPRKILIGAQEIREFESWVYETMGYWQACVGFNRPGLRPYESPVYKMWGLPVTVVPTMSGVLVLDDVMLEVPATPPRP
jgi:hypothetical protein